MTPRVKTGIYEYFFIFLILSLITLIRPINHDESYYTYSSLAIAQGKLPYIDFMFHQLPLMLYIYIPVSFYGISSLFLGRLLTVVLLIISYFLIDKYFIKPKFGSKYHYIFLALFFLNSFLINWITVIKVYSLSILLLTIILVNFNKLIEKPGESKINIFVCFLSLSFLSLTRIVFFINVIVFFTAFIIILYKFDGRKIPLFIISLTGLIIPYIVFWLIFGSNLNLVYENIFSANYLIKQNYENLIPGYFEITAVFFLPQHLILLIIIFTVRKFDLFEKIILYNILMFFILHLNTQMYAEYLTPILPLLIILAIRKWEPFLQNFKYLRKYSLTKRIKIVIIIYLVSIPFGITYLKHPFEGGTFMYNPLQLNSLLNRVNALNGKYILSGWEGYSVYSNKISLAPEQYQGFYLRDMYDQVPGKLKHMMMTSKDYAELIRNGKPDIIVYEPGNPIQLKDMKEEIEKYYKTGFETNRISVYVKK